VTREGAKIVELLNWTGVGIAFPRSGWPQMRSREVLKRSGVYILSGPAEGTVDELPTIYVGQSDEIPVRIDSHHDKEFWDWGYAFVANGNQLNRAHITWLEYALIGRARQAGRCHLDNSNQPKEPGLSESERADTQGFLQEMLRILPILGVRVFEKPAPVAIPGAISPTPSIPTAADARDTVIVPAQEPGFTKVFLGEHSWDAIRIGGGMLEKIKYIAAYQTAPVSAVTHYAPVDRIEPYGEDGKYRLIFAEPAKSLPHAIPFADAPQASMRSPRYTRLDELLSAQKVTDLFPASKVPSDG
jgi:hypothetical protein